MQEDNEIICINSIKNSSVCDGPGIRMVIFFQGCSRRCNGCHNPETWDRTRGESWSIDKLMDYIIKYAKTKRVTLSGGEPLEQIIATERLISLLRNMNYDIALYTGYHIEEVSPNILREVNYIKTGCYIKELRTTVTPYIGSKNQRFQEILKWEG